MADRVPRRRGEPRQDVRQVLEAVLAGDERVERRVGEEAQRQVEPPLPRPARALRRRDVADLRRFQREPLRVEGCAERERYRARAEPAQLEDGRLEAGELEGER